MLEASNFFQDKQMLSCFWFHVLFSEPQHATQKHKIDRASKTAVVCGAKKETLRRSLQKRHCIIFVSIQSNFRHLADLPFKITINIQRTDKQFKVRAVVGQNKKNNTTC